MAFTGPEGLVNAIKAYIEANQGAKFAALNAEYNDGINLEATVATYRGAKSLKSIPNYPALYIVSSGQEAHTWNVDNAEASMEHRPQIDVGILVVDSDEEHLQLRAYRYGRALRELLLEAMGTASLAGWNLATGQPWKEDYDTGPRAVGGTEQSSFIALANLEIRGNKIETK